MKSLFIVTSLLCAISVCTAYGAGRPPTGKVVATVNGAALTDADLAQEVNTIMPMNQSFHGGMSEEKMKKINADALKSLIECELKAQDASAKKIKLSSDEFDTEYKRVTSKFKSKADLEAAYTGAGFTANGFKRIIERKLLAEKARLAEVDAKVTFTPEKVKEYYNNNVSKYSKPDEFRASHILVKIDPSSNSEEKKARAEKAEKLLARIKAGENFQDLAAVESDDFSRIKGGDLGYFHAGQTVPEFEAALVKLKAGEVSGIVESLYGFHIIKLMEKRPSRQIPFAEIQDKLNKDLIDHEKKQLAEKWLKQLFESAKITYPEAK